MKLLKKISKFSGIISIGLLIIGCLGFAFLLYYSENEYHETFQNALQTRPNTDKARTAFTLGLYLQEGEVKTIVNPERWKEIDDWLAFTPKTKCMAIFGADSWADTQKLKLLSNNQIGYEKTVSTVRRFECQALSLSKQTLVIQITGLTFYKEDNEWKIHGWESIEHFLISDDSATCYCPEP